MEKINEKDREFRFGDWGPKYIFRGPRHEWGILLLKPGESLGAHYHREVEETFYFESGSPQMIINDKNYPVAAGDAFRLEPGERHNILNNTSANAKAIFIKCPVVKDDKIDC